MARLKNTKLSKPIAYFQLAQNGVYVSVTDMLSELRIEHSKDKAKFDELGMEQCLTVMAYLQLILDSVPLDGPVPSPNDYLTDN